MAFESLSEKLTGIFKKFTGSNRLSEKNIEEMMEEIKRSLIEADVHVKVVKEFLYDIKMKIVGQRVMSQLNPSQTVVKIVNEELVKALGGQTQSLTFSPNGITTYMLLGLQGSGKTTQAAKLAKLLTEKNHKKLLLVGLDIYRPAAIDQLETLAKQVNVGFYSDRNSKNVVSIALDSLKKAKLEGYDTVIFDTAGRLNIDEILMTELKNLEKTIPLNEKILVVDSLIGQEAANIALSFSKQIKLTGVILTKLDSDTRGGAALSISTLTKLPIKFSGVGEKMDDLEVFHPERMAQRILGMGDILTLIEQAQSKLDQKSTEKAARKFIEGKFDLDDLLAQLEQVKKMGSLGGLMKLIPGLPKLSEEQIAQAELRLKRVKTVIQSMTKKERKNPEIIKGTRKERIAKGAGKDVTEVNFVLKMYEQAKEQSKHLKNFMPKNF